MDSFLIKYDLNDLNTDVNAKNDAEKCSDISEEVKYKESSRRMDSKCVCTRLASILDGVLQKPSSKTDSPATDNNQSSTSSSQSDSSQLNTIQKELKLLRKYQFDLSNKFNSIMTKLGECNISPKNATPVETSWVNSGAQRSTDSSVCLTGAKKRKFNQKWRTDSKPSDEEEVVEEVEETERNCQSRVSNISSSSSSNNLNEIEDGAKQTNVDIFEEEFNEDVENEENNDAYSHEEEPGEKVTGNEYHMENRENNAVYEEDFGDEFENDNQVDDVTEEHESNNQEETPVYDPKYQVR